LLGKKLSPTLKAQLHVTVCSDVPRCLTLLKICYMQCGLMETNNETIFLWSKNLAQLVNFTVTIMHNVNVVLQGSNTMFSDR
jgi:hypothetical protein